MSVALSSSSSSAAERKVKREAKHEIRTLLSNGSVFRAKGHELVDFKPAGADGAFRLGGGKPPAG
jgi:hypothetical protein